MQSPRESSEFTELSNQIVNGIQGVLEGRTLSATDYMRIYRSIYDYCTETEKAHNLALSDEDFNIQGLYGQLIFDQIEKLLENHFENVQKRISNGFYPLITLYLSEWQKCKKQATAVDSICSYLNRNWVRQQRTQSHNKVCGFYQLAIVKWTKKVFYSFHIRLIDEALNLIHKDRINELGPCGDKILMNSPITTNLNTLASLNFNTSPSSSDSAQKQNVISESFNRDQLISQDIPMSDLTNVPPINANASSSQSSCAQPQNLFVNMGNLGVGSPSSEINTSSVSSNKIEEQCTDMMILKEFCDHLQELRNDHVDLKDTGTTAEVSRFSAPANTQNTKSNIYNSEFHSRFMHMTENFYISFSREKFEQNTPTNYLRTLKAASDSEIRRASKYINKNINDDLKRLIDDICISPYLVSLYEAFKKLIVEESSEDIFFFFDLVKNMENVVVNIKNHFTEEFKNILMNKVKSLDCYKNNAYMFMNSIFEMFRKYDDFVKKAFGGNSGFEELKTQAYSQLLNSCNDKNNTNNIHETLSKYVHIVMTTMHDVAPIFRSHMNFTEFTRCLDLIRDKDGFKKSFKELLASRLIGNRTLSLKTEIEIVSYFSTAKEDEFAIPLRKMLSDVDMFTSINENFSCLAGNSNLNTKSYFKCIFRDAWPVNFISECNVPAQIDALYSNFKNFYSTRNKSRKIMFYEHLTQVDIEMPFKSGIYTVSMNGLQASVILLFRFSHSIVFESLMQSTNINKSTLKSIMIGLVNSNLFVCVNKTLNSYDDISLDTEFKLNLDFDSHTKFLAIDMSTKDFKEEIVLPVETEKPTVSELAIQACIVRLLKHDRQIKPKELVRRVLNTLKAFSIKDRDIWVLIF